MAVGQRKNISAYSYSVEYCNCNSMCDLLSFTWLPSEGYNKWRDVKKPSTILAELCKTNGIPSPEYRPSEVKVLNKIFKIPPDAVPEGKDKQTKTSLTTVIHGVKDGTNTK